MFLLVSVRYVGAHPGEHHHGVSIQISTSLGKTFLRISHIRNIPLTWILARVFVYVPPFISQILRLNLLNDFDFDFDLFWMAWHWKPTIGKWEKLPNKEHCSIPMFLKEWRFSRWDVILQINILQQRQISWKLQKACGTHRDLFTSDACCCSQPRFDEAENLFYKLGGGGGERELWLRFIAGRRTYMNV